MARGRPRSDGSKPGVRLSQVAVIVMTYDEARARGEKREAAIVEAMELSERSFPTLPRSRTEIVRMLTEMRPSGLTEGFFFKREMATNLPFGALQIAIPDGLVDLEALHAMARVSARPSTAVITGYYGQIPVIPRSNAASKPRKRPKRNPPSA